MLDELLQHLPDAADQQAESERTARIARARQDYNYFCQTYLGEAFTKPCADYQQILIDIMAQRRITPDQASLLQGLTDPADHALFQPTDRLEGFVDIEPRNHGKTTRNTLAFPLWLLLCHDNIFFILVLASREMASDAISTIMMELELNDQIIDDFGEQKTDKVWNKRKIKLQNGNALAAIGSGQSGRGLLDKYTRPTHITCDDLLKDNEVQSRAMRHKLYLWFKRVVMNLGKGALIALPNTILHPDDLPSRLLAEIKADKLTAWSAVRFSCYRPNGQPLWPEYWSLEDLAQKRRNLGPFVFATEWLNQPLAEEDRKFREDWFQFYQPVDIDWRKLQRVMAVDPATGLADGDYSAICVVGKCRDTGRIYLLDAFAEKISDLALADQIVLMYRQWQPPSVYLETVQFQAIYYREVARAASRQGVHLPLQKYDKKAGDNKKMHILSLAPLLESGLLLLPGKKGDADHPDDHKFELLRDQLLNFPKDHDDLPDALAMAVNKLETGFAGGVATNRAYGQTVAQQLAALAGSVRGQAVW